MLASAGGDRVHLWDTSTGREVAHLAIGFTGSAQFDPRGQGFVTHGQAGLQYWPLRTADPAGPEKGLWCVGPPQTLYQPGNTYFPRASWNGEMRLLAFTDAPHNRALVVHPDQPEKRVELPDQYRLIAIALSPDGKWAASATWLDHHVKVWDAATGKIVKDLHDSGPDVNVFALAFSPHNQWLVVGSASDYRWYRIGSWEPGPKIAKDHSEIQRSPLAFTRDGRLLAIVRTPYTVQLVDPASGREFATLTDPDRHSFNWLSFSPDGSQLAAGTHEQVIQLWDLRLLREQLAELKLDWEMPPYTLLNLDNKQEAVPLHVKVELGNLALASKPPEQSETTKLRQEVEKQSQAIARNPNDAEAYFQRGRLYIRLKEFPKAREDLDRTIALKPDHFAAYHQRGHAYEGLKNAKQAIEDFSTALKGYPENAHLYYVRGRNYSRLMEHANAVDDLNRALELKLGSKQEQAHACDSLAWIQVAGPAQFRARDEALPLAQKAVELAPDIRAYWHTLGVVHYRLGQYKQAVEALERAIKTNKGQATAFDLFCLAMCHHRLGDAAKAKHCYEQAVMWQEQVKLTQLQFEELRAFRAEAEELLAAPRQR